MTTRAVGTRLAGIATALLAAASLLLSGCEGRTSAEVDSAPSPAPIPTVSASATPIHTAAATPTRAQRGEPIASTAALPREQLPPVEFSRAGKPLATLRVEVPPPSEYTVGLSGRPPLTDERGMLFYYAKMGRGSFWMKNTHMDLAIAFVASDGTIVEIVEMQRESTELVTPRADYQYAVEAPSGWYLAHGVRAGDRALLAFPLPSYLTSQ